MKHSIKTQFSLIFILILAGTISGCMICNIIFLKMYYVISRQNAVENAYESLNKASASNEIVSTDFMKELRNICERYGLSIIVMNDDKQVVASILDEDAKLKEQLMDHFFDEVISQNLVIKEGENYTLTGSEGRLGGTGTIEMWGKLDNGDRFLIQSKLEDVSSSAFLANRFLFRIGLISIVLGSLLIVFTTTKITKPLMKLVSISEQMEKLNFDAKFEPDNNGNEVDILGERMNRLSDKLESTISELKTANIELKNDIARKERDEEMRKDFLANVSHELKTPIALIQGYAEGLKEGITDDPESMAFYCDVIVDEANKMNNLVKNLMSLNELEFGADNVVMERFNITELIDNYIQSMDIILQKNDINVIFKNDSPCYVWSDEFKIEEVFRNYFTNAINHIGKERMIEIVIENKEEGIVRVSVFNTGDPIPEESITHLWEKFFKVDKARTREYGGSGVGLSIVKAVMECIHQNYGVENKENGVLFYFEVPTR